MDDTARTRSRVLQAPEYSTCVETWNGDFLRDYTSVISHESETMEDHVTPDFHRRISNGEIINNPCSRSRHKLESIGTGFYQARFGNDTYAATADNLYDYHYNRIGPRIPDITIDIPSGLLTQAKIEAIARIDKSPYAIGEDLFELRETLQFLRDPLSSLRTLLKAFSRRANKLQSEGLSRSKAVANAWLEYRFAISPLIRSIVDILDSFSDNPKHSPRSTSRGRSEWVSDKHYVNGSHSGLLFHKEAERTLTVRAGILSDIPRPKNMLSYKYGLRASDLPLTFWQVMPLSFMVDRVADVSALCQAAVNLSRPGIRILTGWTTVESVLQTREWLTDGPTVPGWNISARSEVKINTYSDYERLPWSPGIVDLKVPVDFRGLVSDATKTLDLLAIIRQVISIQT